jgi:hypothetical protein
MTDAVSPAATSTIRTAPGPLAVGAGLAVGLVTAMLLRIRTTPDVDLYLHLRIGDLLNAGGRFGDGPDPLAALADRPYLPTQWLAQRAMAWTWSVAGMTGIQVIRLLLVIALGATVVAACRCVATPTASGFAAGVAMFGAAAAWGERPQLLGLVLFAAVVWMWWRCTLRGAVPWLVVPLTWVWAMVHGSWLLGVAAGAALLVGAVADRRLRLKGAGLGVLALLASVAAAAMTPLGPRVLTEPFTVARIASQSVNEWARPELANPVFLVVLVTAVVAGAGLVRSATHRWTRTLSFLAGLALTLWMVRTVAFGSVLLAPVVAHALATLRRPDASTATSVHREWPVWALAVTTVLVVGGWHVARTPFGPPVSLPLSAALASTSPTTPLAVDGKAVGWVQWQHRDRRPLHDLRAEVYSAPVAAAYRSFADAEPGWETYAAGLGIGTILAERDSPLDNALEAAGGWSVAEEDADFRLWRTAALVAGGDAE